MSKFYICGLFGDGRDDKDNVYSSALWSFEKKDWFLMANHSNPEFFVADEVEAQKAFNAASQTKNKKTIDGRVLTKVAVFKAGI